jgi:hypothetical protein
MFGSYLGVKNISVSKAAKGIGETPECKDNAAERGRGKSLIWLRDLEKS